MQEKVSHLFVCEVFLYPGHSESHFQFHQAVIRSKARTTYHQVEEYYSSHQFPGQADEGVLSSLDCLRDVYFILQRNYWKYMLNITYVILLFVILCCMSFILPIHDGDRLRA